MLLTLTLLRRRDFALLWSAGFISRLGDWMLFAALPFYVYARTGSALATGAMFIAETVPTILLGSVAGVFVDRWDHRRTMVAAAAARGALLLLLLAAQARDALPLVYVVALLQSAIGQFFWPARGALVPRLIGEERLQAANALASLGDNLPRLVGPAIGGVLLGLVGLSGVVLADSASFLLSAGLVALIAVAPLDRETCVPAARVAALTRWTAFWREWAEGLRIVRGNRALTTLFAVQGVAMVGQGIFEVLRVPFIRDVLHGNAQVFGLLVSIEAVGGLLGGALVGAAGHVLAPGRLLALAVAMVAMLMLVGVNVPILPLAVGLFAVAGLPMVAWLVSSQTVAQGAAPDRYRGRVFGAYGTTTALATVGGMALASVGGTHAAIAPLLNVAGGLHVAAAVLAFALPRAAGPEASIDDALAEAV